MIHSVCLCSRHRVSERGKLYYTYNIFMSYILCIRKKETASYLHFVYGLYFVYQKEENCIMPTICLWPMRCVSERGELYHTYNMCMAYVLCIRKRETVSCLEYVYELYVVYQKEGNCIIPTIYLCSRLCVSERGKLYHTCSMCMYYFVYHLLYSKKKRKGNVFPLEL